MSDIDKVIEKLEAIGVPAWEAVVHMVLIQGWMFLISGIIFGAFIACGIRWLSKNLRKIDEDMIVGPLILFLLIGLETIAAGFIINGIYNLLATEGIAISRIL